MAVALVMERAWGQPKEAEMTYSGGDVYRYVDYNADLCFLTRAAAATFLELLCRERPRRAQLRAGGTALSTPEDADYDAFMDALLVLRDARGPQQELS